MKVVATLAALVAGLPLGSAYFILTQNVLETTRLDPILSPGGVSGHVHSIVGGSNFASSVTYDSMREGTCTTAPVTVDLSNYWAPQLYYYSPDQDAFTLIPTAYMNAYYLVRPGVSGIVQAFPDGLRMLSGDSTRRTFNDTDPDDLAITFVCLDYSADHTGDPDWEQRNSFFDHNCPDGLRAQVNFPNCWDGVNLDSSDHKSHMAWPSGGVNGGDCPDSHPVHLVSLFYEYIFSVQNYPFNDPSYPTWVFANGDSTGYGFHGDFINGWPSLVNGTNVLQEAIDQCDADSGVGGELYNCPPLAPYVNNAAASACVPENPIVNEDIGSGDWLATLPGNNPLYFNGSLSASVTKTTPTFYTPQSAIPTGWTDVGCIAEGSTGRALASAQLYNANMTRAVCVEWCADQGYPLAGMEYSDECYCGYQMQNGATNTTLLDSSRCDMKCANNEYETCGGSSTLELFVNPTLFPAPLTLPTGWESTGCMTEGSSGRALTGYSFISASMTPLMCIQTCADKGFALAGVEYASECYCGNEYNAGSVIAPDTDCNMACKGSPTDLCGGPNRLTTFNNTTPAVAAPVVLPTGWTTFGCISEPSNTRALSAYSFSSPSMTTNLCISTCQGKGYFYAGTEYADECYCADKLSNGYANLTTSSCSMSCAGDSTLNCGGPSTLNIYVSVNSTLPPAPLPTNWTSIGCYLEPTNGRALDGYMFESASMTTDLCITTCASRGYLWAGTEYSTQCFCDNSLSSAAVAQSASTCNMACSGDATSICGGGSLLSIYQSNQTEIQAALAQAAVPSGWSALGCYTDSGSRTLNGPAYIDGKMTWASCTAYCASAGYSFAGVEYGTQCYCDNEIAATASVAPSSDCSMDCGGDSSALCGGSWRLNMFEASAGVVSATTTVTTTVVTPGTTTASTTTTTAGASETLPSGWTALGCYVDTGSRTLNGASYIDGSVTWASCSSFCASHGYSYAGMEYSTQCYCGDSLDSSMVADSGDCNMACGGDKSAMCGGNWRLTVFGSSVSSSGTITTTTTTTTAATTTTTVTTTATAKSTITAAGTYTQPSGYIHCFVDQLPYMLNGTSSIQSGLTNELCISQCGAQGYAFAGTEYSTQCYCGNYLNLANLASESDCNMGCDGNSAEACGGNWRISVSGTGVGEGVVYGNAPSTASKRSPRRLSMDWNE